MPLALPQDCDTGPGLKVRFTKAQGSRCVRGLCRVMERQVRVHQKDIGPVRIELETGRRAADPTSWGFGF